MAIRTILALLFGALVLVGCSDAGPKTANPDAAPVIGVSEAKMRLPLGGQKVTAAYMTLTNSGTLDDKLVGASCDCAGRVEIHTMSMEGGMMKMDKIDAFDLKVGQTQKLEQGGLHLMLFDLKPDLGDEGQKVDITLQFEKAGQVIVDAELVSLESMKHSH